MHPSIHARAHPDKPAYIMAASGETVTYGQLDARSNQGAHLLRSLGVQAGDAIALFMDNSPRYYEVLWAAQRSGLRFTCISSKLTAGEVEYIVKDSGSKVLIASAGVAPVALEVAPLIPGVKLFMVDGAEPPFESFEDARGGHARRPRSPTRAPARPCSIPPAPPGGPRGSSAPAPWTTSPSTRPTPSAMIGQALYGWTEDTVYLSPAPLYHAAPLGWSMAVQAMGGTVILMERFDPEQALADIEKYKVTSAQWVPTHFVRMLKLPPEVRAKYDLSSPQERLPRRRAVPDPGQGADDRLVGSDHQRVLRRHGGQRLLHHHLRGMAAQEGLGGQGPDRRGQDLRRGRQSCAAAHRRRRLSSPAAASSNTTTIRSRPPRAATGTAGRPWATWAGWTRRAISSSPTARAS